MSKKRMVSALGAALLASATVATAVAPAHAAGTTSQSGTSRATATIETPLVSGFYSGASLLNAHSVASDGFVDGTPVASFSAAASRSTLFTAPAPTRTGTITAGGLCLTSDRSGLYVIMAACTGAASQTSRAVLDDGAIGVHYQSSTGQDLIDSWDGSRQRLRLTSSTDHPTFVTFSTDSARVTGRSVVVSGHGVPGQQLVLNSGVTTTVAADSTWSATVTGLASGSNTITVQAKSGDNVVGSQAFSVTVDAAAELSASIGFDADLSQLATMTGTGTDGGTIVVTSGGRQIGTTTVANGTWSLDIPASIGAGSHSFSVAQTVNGQADGSVTVTKDFGAAITASATIADRTATITGTGSDGAMVVVTDNGTRVGSATVAGGRYSISVANVSNGQHTYTVTQQAPGNIVTSTTATATRASAVVVTNPADPALGYTPNSAFTFRGTAPRTAGDVTIRNMRGTLIATVPVDPTTGAWSWTRPNMGTSDWMLTFTIYDGTPTADSYTLPTFSPNAQPALDLKVENPADPSVGYTPNTAFTFSGVAKKTAGTVTIRNFAGTLIATVPVDATTGAWSWTRANMGTAVWKLSFFTEEKTPNEQKVTLGDFAPNARQALQFTNPTNPAAGYTANTAFTFRGTALPGASIVLTNDKGTVIASGIKADASGNWSWTRNNMGTSIWKVTATADAGTDHQQKVTLGDFAPKA